MAGSRPAVEGWFTEDSLLGTRCRDCGTYTFPPRKNFCPNPDCASGELEEVPLSRRGRVWSYTVNHYEAPPPFCGTAPYSVVAVELAAEGLVVLGCLAAGSDPSELEVGRDVEVVIEPIFTDEEGIERLGWAWRPT